MKRKIQNIVLTLATAWLVNMPAPVFSQDSIVYVNGPSFPFQYGVEPADSALDLNSDGTPDFSFQLGYFIGPACLGCGASAPYFVWGFETNSTQFRRFDNGSVLSFGALIGDPPPTNAIWNSPDQAVTIATLFIGGASSPGQTGLYGPLANAGVGYVGVRFHAADGLHYGWVRVQGTLHTLPVSVVDWAYESRPNTPILAGEIGSQSESRQFTVNFPNGDTGSLILTRDQLRCELALNGQFTSAELIRSSRGNSKLIADLGQPLAARTNYTSFFRDVKLSRGEVVQLLRGATYLSIDSGAVSGKIVPID